MTSAGRLVTMMTTTSPPPASTSSRAASRVDLAPRVDTAVSVRRAIVRHASSASMSLARRVPVPTGRVVGTPGSRHVASPRASLRHPPTPRASSSAPPPQPETPTTTRRDVLLRASSALATFAGWVLLPSVPSARAVALDRAFVSPDAPFEELEARARTAYRAKRLEEAYDLLTRIIALEPDDGQWYERRAQVLVDLKRFRAAVDDFDAAVAKYEPEYRSLGLLSNRALAYEGLSDWNSAIRDYDEVIRLSGEIGRVPPYVLNSRGNARSSVGDYEGALEDYVASAAAFQGMRNLSGAIYARSNAALTLAELGREDEAMREMEAVARRAAGSIDMRAALAAMHWSRGEPELAEEKWNWACEKINSGVLTEGGPALDGCALYRDMDWLARIRRWPPSMVRKMDAFVNLRERR